MQIEIVTNDVPPAQRTRHLGQKGYFFKSYEELRHTRDLTTLPHGIFFRYVYDNTWPIAAKIDEVPDVLFYFGFIPEQYAAHWGKNTDVETDKTKLQLLEENAFLKREIQCCDRDYKTKFEQCETLRTARDCYRQIAEDRGRAINRFFSRYPELLKEFNDIQQEIHKDNEN